jgi:hypothetical protein
MTVSSRFQPSSGNAPREERPLPSIWRVTLALAVAAIVLFILIAILLWTLFQVHGLFHVRGLVLGLGLIGLAVLGMFESLRRTLKTPARDTVAIGGFFVLTFALVFVVPVENIPEKSALATPGPTEAIILALMVLVLTPTLMLAVGNSRQLVRRLSLAVAGLVVLFVLSKLSALALDLRAPKPTITGFPFTQVRPDRA